MNHLYGILSASEAPKHWAAVQGVQLQTIVVGRLAAIVSVPLIGQTVEQALLHNRIVETSLELVPLLPARFAAPISSLVLEQHLNNQAAALSERLNALRFTREFALRAELHTLPEVQSSPITSGRAYLESKAALRRLSQAQLNLCLQLKADIAKETLFLESRVLESNQKLYRLAYLVAQDQLQIFHQALEKVIRLHCQNFFRITIHGAFSPYSFAEIKEKS